MTRRVIFPGPVEPTHVTSCHGGQVGIHTLELDRGAHLQGATWRPQRRLGELTPIEFEPCLVRSIRGLSGCLGVRDRYVGGDRSGPGLAG